MPCRESRATTPREGGGKEGVRVDDGTWSVSFSRVRQRQPGCWVVRQPWRIRVCALAPARHPINTSSHQRTHPAPTALAIWGLKATLPNVSPHLSGLWDVLLCTGGVPGVRWHVAHLRLRLDGDDAHGHAVEARAARDHAARPAGLRLHPAAAVKQARLPAGLAAVAAWRGGG